jgi:ribosomal protein S18 acetylase RimI-like enzyme
MTSSQDKKSDQVQIKPVGEVELPSILEVYRQCEDFLALGPVAVASVQMVLADLQLSKDRGGIFCGIYIPESKLVGVIDYIPHHYLGDARHAYIELLMIARPYRRNGLGSAVVTRIESEIRRDPVVNIIKAGVAVNNVPAITFWLKQGYRITGDPEVFPDQTSGFPLEKNLESL